MIFISGPDKAHTENKVALGGVTYTFTYRYNTYTKRWALDIRLNGKDVILGESLVEGSPLFYAKSIPDFSHGVLTVVPTRETTNPCGISNLGVGKEYVLTYITNEELQYV